METIFCFVRHGQTEINHMKKIQGRQDHLLNDTGRKQAHSVGKYLASNDNNFDLIISSPLSRAFETASIIKEELGFKKEIIKNESFIERDFGDAEGMDITKEIFYYIVRDEVNNLEKSFEIQKRVTDEIINLSHKYYGKRILVVAHSHTIKAILTKIDSTRSFNDTLVNCSMNYFIVKNDKIMIDKVNISAE